MVTRKAVRGYPEGPVSEEAPRHLSRSGLPTDARPRMRAPGAAASIMARRLQIAGLVTIVLALSLALVLRSHDIDIFADGRVTTISTRNADDTTIVQRAGIDLGPADVVESLGADALVVRRARSVLLQVDGRLGAAVKGASLIGNGPDVLTRVKAVGNDMALDPGIGTCGKNGQAVPVGVGLPTLLIDGLTVGGTEM